MSLLLEDSMRYFLLLFEVEEARVKGAPDLCMRYPATGAERMKRNQCQDRSRMTGMNAVVMISGRTHCRYTTIQTNYS